MNGLTLVLNIEVGHAIWHVSFGGADSLVGRRQAAELTGAWVFEGPPQDLSSFTYGRVLLQGSDLPDALDEFANETRQLQKILQDEFEAWVARAKKSLKPPFWPEVRQFDLAATALIGTPEPVRIPLAYAMWARDLLGAWRITEDLRVSRTFLHGTEGSTARLLPPTWGETWYGNAA